MNESVDGYKNDATYQVALMLFNTKSLIDRVLEQSNMREPNHHVLRNVIAGWHETARLLKGVKLDQVDWQELVDEFKTKLAEGSYNFYEASDVVIRALRGATIDGTRVVLNGQLARTDYEAVDKVLRQIGGKWDRKARAHVFAKDPSEHIAHIIETGNLSFSVDTNPHDFYPTALELGTRLIREHAGHLAGMPLRVLEPSIGKGDFARAAAQVLPGITIDAFEIDPERAEISREGVPLGTLTVGDFLEADPEVHPTYDLVVMNPPFDHGADARHIQHAMRFLKPGGTLIAIAGGGLAFRKGPIHDGLRAMCEGVSMHGNATIKDLPDGSFKHAGTSVRTVALVIRRSVMAERFPGFELPKPAAVQRSSRRAGIEDLVRDPFAQTERSARRMRA